MELDVSLEKLVNQKSGIKTTNPDLDWEPENLRYHQGVAEKSSRKDDRPYRIGYAIASIIFTLWTISSLNEIHLPVPFGESHTSVWLLLIVFLLSAAFLHLKIVSTLFAFLMLYLYRYSHHLQHDVFIAWTVFTYLGAGILFFHFLRRWDRRPFIIFIGFCLLVQMELQLHTVPPAKENYSKFLQNLPEGFNVHEYFQIPEGADLTHVHEFMYFRTKKIHDQFVANKNLNFRIEKSKCFMYDFLQRHSISHVPVLGQWDSKEAFWSWIESEEASFPLIVKFCHLTQGGQAWKGYEEISGNSFFIKNAGAAKSDLFHKWVNVGWDLIPRDPGRVWEPNMREPLESLERGIFVQPAWHFFPGMSQPLELKIFVIWGKAFFVRFETGYPDWLFGNTRNDRFYVLPNIDLKVRDNTNMFFRYWNTASPVFAPIRNFEDHLRAAIQLAESDAQTLKADFLRVDIFLNPDDPSSPAINEHSLLEIYRFLNENYVYAAKAIQLGYQSSNLKTCKGDEDHIWNNVVCS